MAAAQRAHSATAGAAAATAAPTIHGVRGKRLRDGTGSAPGGGTGELAAALAAVHACSVAHRDVKPSDILLGRERPMRTVCCGCPL
ncbi:hypothetical protein [Streptomyces sp. NPDC046197]|uniref:hypothetical protein n=1 Tax=Streptomyces sp. NPDC046197 TaxID=3154337 RepID=UPI0033D2FB47